MKRSKGRLRKLSEHKRKRQRRERTQDDSNKIWEEDKEESADEDRTMGFLSRMKNALGNTTSGHTQRYSRDFKRRRNNKKKHMQELDMTFFEQQLANVILERGEESHEITQVEWRRIMKEEERSRMRANLQLYVNHAKLAQSVDSGTSRAFKKIGLRSRPFLHQLSALAWLMLREQIPFKGQRVAVLADEMGAGKTLTTLMLIAMDRVCGYRFDPTLDMRHEKPTLVICPAAIIDTWLQQAQEHFVETHLKVVAPSRGKRGMGSSGPQNWRHTTPASVLLNSDMVIISYDSLRITYTELKNEFKAHARANPDKLHNTEADPRDAGNYEASLEHMARRLSEQRRIFWDDTDEWYARHMIMFYPWRRVVFDECSHFKNTDTYIAEAAEALDAERRIFISGTPIENSVDNMFSLLRAMHFAPLERPKRWWRKILDGHNPSDTGDVPIPENTDSDDEELVSDGNSDASSIVSTNSEKREEEEQVQDEWSDDDELEMARHEERNERLRRRFLTVLQLRRSLETAPLSNQLQPYMERSEASEEVWKTITSARKAWRFKKHSKTLVAQYTGNIYSSGDSSDISVSEEEEQEEEKDGKSGINDTTEKRETRNLDFSEHSRADYRKALAELQRYPEGFYLDTTQDTFVEGVSLVDTWLDQALGLGLKDINGAVVTARTRLRDLGIDRVANAQQYKQVYGNLPQKWPDGTALDAVYSDHNPRTILLVSPMSDTEKEINNALLKHSNTRRSAFGVIASARIIASDYRCSQFSAGYLHEQAKQRGITSKSKKGLIPVAFTVQGKRPSAAAQKYASYVFTTTQRTSRRGSSAASVALKAVDSRVDAVDEDEIMYEHSRDDNHHHGEKKNEIDAPRGIYFVPKEPPTKYRMLLDYIHSVPEEDKIVVFSDQVRFFAVLRDYLEEHNIPTGLYEGDMSPKNRHATIEEFRQPHCESALRTTGHRRRQKANGLRVLVTSLKCGAMGLNLQMANHVVVFMPWWNPSIEDQCMHRVMRLSQKKRIHLIFLALLDSIDEFILAHADNVTRIVSDLSHTPDPLLARVPRYNRPDLEDARLLDPTGSSVLARDPGCSTGKNNAFVNALPKCDVLENRRLQIQQLTNRAQKKLSKRALLNYFVTQHIDSSVATSKSKPSGPNGTTEEKQSTD